MPAKAMARTGDDIPVYTTSQDRPGAQTLRRPLSSPMATWPCGLMTAAFCPAIGSGTSDGPGDQPRVWLVLRRPAATSQSSRAATAHTGEPIGGMRVITAPSSAQLSTAPELRPRTTLPACPVIDTMRSEACASRRNLPSREREDQRNLSCVPPAATSHATAHRSTAGNRHSTAISSITWAQRTWAGTITAAEVALARAAARLNTSNSSGLAAAAG